MRTFQKQETPSTLSERINYRQFCKMRVVEDGCPCDPCEPCELCERQPGICTITDDANHESVDSQKFENQDNCRKPTHVIVKDQVYWDPRIGESMPGAHVLPERIPVARHASARGGGSGTSTPDDTAAGTSSERVANPVAPGIPLTSTPAPANLRVSSRSGKSLDPRTWTRRLQQSELNDTPFSADVQLPCLMVGKYQPIDRGKVLEPKVIKKPKVLEPKVFHFPVEQLQQRVGRPQTTSRTLAEDLYKLISSVHSYPPAATSGTSTEPWTSPGATDLVINLAERAQLRDQSGRCHFIIAVHDGCSDSSWISANLASSFPPKMKKQVLIPLQTIQETSSFQTYEYHLQILAGDTFKAIKVYESPDLGTVQYNSDLDNFLQQTFNTDIHLPRGDVDLIIGLREHGLSPDSIKSSRDNFSQATTPNLKLYESALVRSRKLACGSIPESLIEFRP